MKVVLPDKSELELPDGATGLDAARAIGPKLAEQAVLVRSNGHVQDLRLPLEDGREIQILTTRDKQDPDALYVLRHSTAHLLAEAVRRLYPGVKIAIGPPIENGFYYDFQFPEPIHEEDLERIEAEIERELEEGREWSRQEISREEAKERFEREHEPYKVALDLFHFDEHSPGSAFWHPKGMAVWNILEDVRRSENQRRGYVEVKTPLIYDKALWVTSGHWEKFREHMFLIPLDDEQVYGIKPMNCPGHMLLFGNTLRSYRELPLRYAEAAPLHRNELAGVLHGLTRVRHVTQDDAHIFCTQEQIPAELDECIDYLHFLYGLFGLEARAEFSTRPDNKLGTDGEWDFAEAEIQAALERNDIPYVIGQGEGSFYGPKIDLHVADVLGRSWQLGTIQLDRQMPARFGLTYMGPDNTEHPVFVIHRALYGVFERFTAILFEQHRVAMPFWIAPVQIRVIPVGTDHREAAERLRKELAEYRVDVDDRDETVGRRIRDAELEKIPYVIVYGDKESDASLAIRKRGGEQANLPLAKLREELATL